MSSLKVLIGNKSQVKLVEDFEKIYVKQGKFNPQHLRILKGVLEAREEHKKGKSNSHKIDRARKDADILVRDLVEFNQRKDLVSVDKGRMRLKLKDKVIEILNANGKSFIFDGQIIKKIEDKIINSSIEEVEESIGKQKEKEFVEFDCRIFDVLKKEYGKFEIII